MPSSVVSQHSPSSNRLNNSNIHDEPIFSLELSHTDEKSITTEPQPLPLQRLQLQLPQMKQSQSRGANVLLSPSKDKATEQQQTKTRAQAQTNAQQIPQHERQQEQQQEQQQQQNITTYQQHHYHLQHGNHSDSRQLIPSLHIHVTDYSPETQTSNPMQSSPTTKSSSWGVNGSLHIPISSSTSSTIIPTSTNDSRKSRRGSRSRSPSPTSDNSSVPPSNNLAVPNQKTSTRWSLSGRFFGGDRRKSSSEQSPSIPANSNNSKKLSTSLPEKVSTSPSSGSGFSNLIRTRSRSGSGGGSGNGSSSAGKHQNSSSSGGHRSSITSLFSWRRPSNDPPPSSGYKDNQAMAAATAAVSASIAAAMGTSPKAYASPNGEFDDEGGDYFSRDRGWLGENRYMAYATQKGSPESAMKYGKRFPPKSILKKRASIDEKRAKNNAMDIISPTPRTATPLQVSGDSSSTIHRAKLVTNSPPPSASHHQPLPSSPSDDSSDEAVDSVEAPPTSNSSSKSSSSLDSSRHHSKSKYSYSTTATHKTDGSTPTECKPGMQSNAPRRSRGDEMSQAEMMNDEMMSVGARVHMVTKRQGGNGMITPEYRRRNIGFSDKIEIIPVLKKADYDRQSDRNVTFKILTPEMRCEIRDELNDYKMKEMAVHIDKTRFTPHNVDDDLIVLATRSEIA
ncbi:hypothetical protein BGZ76_002504 [Entomortierella beljakovae]|nr:hypothetical protein BGZ76_002504 [Entomortierella beljakovae]